MTKFVYIEADENRVKYVEDYRETGEVSEYEPYTVGQVRQMRDEKLTVSDWMVLEDSPYKATGQESNLAAIKTYRQELRDFPDESKSYDENNINWPTLTLS